MSETITEKPSTYQAKNSNHCLRSYFYPAFLYANSYDVTDNKTNEMFLHQWKPEQFTMDEKYQREDERLKTFDNWPLEWLNKRELAQTGLFYTGDDDKVKCYFCEVEIGRWEREDQPVNEHLRFSPNCPLLRRRTTNNVALNSDTLNRVLPPVSYDVCGNEGLESELEASESAAVGRPEDGLTTATSGITYQYDSIASGDATTHNNSGVNDRPTLNEVKLFRPEYPEYTIEAARLRSFAEWPRNMKQRPAQLADAGFFYTGIGDRVKCFSCGCGLKDWDNDDEPWEQHALWFPKCRYLNLLKDPSYIDSVAAKFKVNNGKSADKGLKSSGQQCSTSDTTVAQPVMATISTPKCTTSAEKDDMKLKEANIPDEKLCKICYADEYNTAFLPCGHVVACAKCASSVSKCPVCRKPFTNVMRVFFP